MDAVSAYSKPLPVFEAYKGYPPCYRQPLLVPTGNNNLVVFVEGRNNSYCSGTNDGNIQTIEMKTSSDGGATWSDMVTLFTGHVDFLAATYDGQGTVHLMVRVRASGVPSRELAVIPPSTTFSNVMFTAFCDCRSSRAAVCYTRL